MDTKTLEIGTPVRFTAPLGFTNRLSSSDMAGTVKPGDTGMYVGHPPQGLLDDDQTPHWHVVAVLADVPGDVRREYVCLCHESQFEAIRDADHSACVPMDPRVTAIRNGRWPCDCGAAHQNRRPHDPHCIRYIEQS